jgi:hypothetical protein
VFALLLAVGVGAAIVGVVVAGDDEPASAAQLAQVRESCGEWMTSSHSEDQWCTDMFTWMSDRSQGSMMGSMMWQGPEEMGTTCREWVAVDHPELSAAGPQRCAEMVAWMDGHMTSHGGRWMMQDR